MGNKNMANGDSSLRSLRSRIPKASKKLRIYGSEVGDMVLILPDQTIASGNQFIYGEQCDRLSSTH
jgi:hypothetical protein